MKRHHWKVETVDMYGPGLTIERFEKEGWEIITVGIINLMTGSWSTCPALLVVMRKEKE